MKSYFLELFEYNKWANELVHETLQPLDPKPEKPLLWFSHIVAAELLWFNRLSPGSKKIPLWETVALTELRQLQFNADNAWLKWIRKYDGAWDAPLSYKNTGGEHFITPIYQILAHVVNHGTHHRGMIVASLRDARVEPPQLDLIFYTRRKKAFN